MDNYMGFYNCLLQEILEDVYNFYEDNTDFIRFSLREENKCSFKDSVKELFKKIIRRSKFGAHTVFTDKFITQDVTQFDFEGLNWLFNLLGNEYSKRVMIKIIAYRILGKERVRLPLNKQTYWDQRKKINAMIDKRKEPVQVDFMNWELPFFNFSENNFDIKLFSRNPQNIFFIKQYEYIKEEVKIKAEKGDYVIDAGGCWGDTALYFALETAPNGMVYSFEFIPSNLKVMKKNLLMNPDLEKRIKCIEKPIWIQSGIQLNYIDNGPASRIIEHNNFDNVTSASTISIDDFVIENNLKRIDFIKMDIEGAELKALKGAREALRKFKPKLAISVYHSLSDYIAIPQYINSLNLGYSFYLNHHTIHSEESILYATTE